MLPYFKRGQCQAPGANKYHGIDGPSHVQNFAIKNTLSRVFIEAAKQAGYTETPDFKHNL